MMYVVEQVSIIIEEWHTSTSQIGLEALRILCFLNDAQYGRHW